MTDSPKPSLKEKAVKFFATLRDFIVWICMLPWVIPARVLFVFPIWFFTLCKHLIMRVVRSYKKRNKIDELL
jgi:hypothetical protein